MNVAMAAPARVVVVGGGFTGAMVAVNLARRTIRPICIDIVEPRPMLGGGVAYSAADPAHRINVPASRMTVFTEDPTHFDRWLRAGDELTADPAAAWSDTLAFVQRAVFGRYIAGLVKAAAAIPGVTIRHRRGRVAAVLPGTAGFAVAVEAAEGEALEGGAGLLHADVLVLAVSHPPPAVPAALRPAMEQGAAVIADPWSAGALDRLEPGADVLIVGTGLTMADVVATLERRGHTGAITAVSRRGLLSRGHVFEAGEWAWAESVAPPVTALALVRAIRGEVMRAAAAGQPWQVVFDDVRARGRRLWSALPEAEQRRVVRHIRPFWDVHRFRVAPQIEAAIERLRGAGQFTSLAASLLGADRDGSKINVRLRPRRARSGVVVSRAFDAIVVTTGPAHDAAVRTNPALASLARLGLIRADRVGLGLAVDAASCAVGENGVARPDLLVAGPLARGRFGELMGLPQVSEHAEDVATQVLAVLSREARVAADAAG